MSDWITVGEAPKDDGWSTIGEAPGVLERAGNWLSDTAETVGKHIAPWAAPWAAAGDMVIGAVNAVPQGLGGLARGAGALAGGASPDEAVNEAVSAMDWGHAPLGNLTGLSESKVYDTTNEVLDTPIAAAKLAGRGLLGLSSAIGNADLAKGVEYIENPEKHPITSALNDAIGTLVGGVVGAKLARVAGEGITRGKYEKPSTEIDLGETPKPSKVDLVDPEIVRKEGLDVVDDNIQNKYSGQGEVPPGTSKDLFQEDYLKRYQEEADAQYDAYRKRQDIEAEERLIDSERRAQYRDYDAQMEPYREERRQRKLQEEELKKPLDFGLTLEDHPLREESRLSNNDAITRGREQFPTIDFDLLPERVAKDSVVKGLITKYNNLHTELRTLYQTANNLGIEGTRIRFGELGLTKKSKAEINALRSQIESTETKLNNLAKQLQRRMEVKHNFVYDEGWTGAPLYEGAKPELKLTDEGKVVFEQKEGRTSVGGKGVKTIEEVPVTETSKGVYSEEPPSVVGPAERTTGLQVEKTERANMERSSEADVTGGEMVEKTPEFKLSDPAELGTSEPKGPTLSRTRGLNKGPGGKQSGGTNFGLAEKVGDKLAGILGKGKTPQPKPNKAPKGPITTHMLEEMRDIETFMKEELPNASSWRDINLPMIQNLLQGRATASIYKRANPLVRYIVHKTIALDREAHVAKENAKWGDNWRNNFRGWAKRVKSEAGALTFLESAKEKDARGVHEALIKYDKLREEPTKESLLADGLNDRQATAVMSIRRQLDKLFDSYNEWAKQNGKPEVAKLPGFFPHVWFGDYRVFVRDGTGELVDVRGFNSKYEANAFLKGLEGKLPADHKVSGIERADQGKYKLNDLNAFRYAMGVLSRDTPARNILEQTFNDVIKHRGFRTHTLRRKGAGGFAGSELTTEGTRELTRALDTYLSQGYTFLANQKKRALLGELTDALAKNKDKVPPLKNTENFINEYVQHSTGMLQSRLEGLDNIIENVGEASGFGPGSPLRALKDLSGMAAFYWLTTLKNYSVQMIQPLMNIPKLENIKAEYKTEKGAYRAFATGILQTLKPTAYTKEALTFAKQRGYIDAKTLELVNEQFSKLGVGRAVMSEVHKRGLGLVEQEIVRTPSFLMYDHILKDVIPDKRTRWQTAGALTEQYMVNYHPTESPMMYAKSGIVGEAAKPLKQFSHAYYGALTEMTHLALTEKQFSPLAHFLAVQWLMSGAKGMPLVGAATGAILAINAITGANWKTPEEAMLSSGMSSTVTWGPLSTITGIDVSNSVGAPGLETFMTSSPVSFAAQLAAVPEYAIKAAAGMDTEADKYRAMKAGVPLALQPVVEEAFTNKKGQVLDPKTNLPGDYQRSSSERIKRLISGGTLTEENIHKARIRATEKQDEKDSKAKATIMKKMVNDIVYQKKGISPELVQKYVDNGGNPANLKSELKGFMIKSVLSYAERRVMAAKGIEGLKRLQNTMEYKLLKAGEIDEDVLLEQYKRIEKE